MIGLISKSLIIKNDTFSVEILLVVVEMFKLKDLSKILTSLL